MNKFVIGDIHNNYHALKEVLKKSEFDYDKDRLISLGDLVDGKIGAKGVVEELLKIKDFVFCLGNHDDMFIKFFTSGFKWMESVWTHQGGANTLASYGAKIINLNEDSWDDSRDKIILDNVNIPVTHQDLFNRAKLYHLEDGGTKVFVHGGFNPKIPLMSSQSRHDLLWDRQLIQYAMTHYIPGFKEVYVGHTTTELYGFNIPIRYHNLIMMDTGSGLNGRLTIMNIDNKEIWQSKKQ